MASSLLLALLLHPAAAEERTLDRIAAVVNEDVIALSQVYELGSDYIQDNCGDDPSCRTEAELSVLDALVRQSLMRQDLVRLGYDARPEDVDLAIEQVMAEYGFPDREALRQEVERTGVSWEEYRSKLSDDIRLQRFQGIVLRNRVTLTDDELQDRYQRRLRTLESPLVARLSAFGYHLPTTVTPEERVAFVTEFVRLFASVRQGARTWESVVAEYDTAGMARAFGGRAFRETDLTGPLATAAFTTPVGEIADPLLVGGVLYGVRVDARDEAPVDPPSFESLKDELAQELFEEKLTDAEESWYEVARRQAAIRLLLLPPPPPEEPAPAE